MNTRHLVTKHAAVRYLQRICGAVNLEAETRGFLGIEGPVADHHILVMAAQKHGLSREHLAAEILEPRVLQFIRIGLSGHLRLERMSYVIQAGRVISVYDAAERGRDRYSVVKRGKLVRKRLRKARRA